MVLLVVPSPVHGTHGDLGEIAPPPVVEDKEPPQEPPLLLCVMALLALVQTPRVRGAALIVVLLTVTGLPGVPGRPAPKLVELELNQEPVVKSLTLALGPLVAELIPKTSFVVPPIAQLIALEIGVNTKMLAHVMLPILLPPSLENTDILPSLAKHNLVVTLVKPLMEQTNPPPALPTLSTVSPSTAVGTVSTPIVLVRSQLALVPTSLMFVLLAQMPRTAQKLLG